MMNNNVQKSTTPHKYYQLFNKKWVKIDTLLKTPHVEYAVEGHKSSIFGSCNLYYLEVEVSIV
jgi:hypothetical protein